MSLVVEVEPQGLGFSERRGTRNTDIELHVTATDPSSKTPVDSRYHLAELRLRPETYERVKAEGVRITRRLDLRPGRYRVQVGVRDKTSGLAGTLFMDVDVPDLFKPPLAMSGIVLVSAAATRVPTIAPDRALATLLRGPHTARREFSPNDTLAVFAEICDNDLATPHRLVVKTTVLDHGGAEVFSKVSEHGTEDLVVVTPRKRGTLKHVVTIPASALPPGPLVVRVEAKVVGAGGRTAMRQVPFTIRNAADR